MLVPHPVITNQLVFIAICSFFLGYSFPSIVFIFKFIPSEDFGEFSYGSFVPLVAQGVASGERMLSDSGRTFYPRENTFT